MTDLDDFNEAYDPTDMELDCCLALNLMLGKPYHEAIEEARSWYREAHESTTLP